MDSTNASRPKLTVGMACYDNFNGVYFSVQALQLYHAEAMRQRGDPRGRTIVPLAPTAGTSGTLSRTRWAADGISPPRKRSARRRRADIVFREAAGQAVLCIDAHVLIAPGAIRKLIEFYDADPACRDLLHGPMLTNDNKGMSTHMEPVWRCENVRRLGL